MNGSEIRVLVQNGEYWLANNGDLAMLDTTLGQVAPTVARRPDRGVNQRAAAAPGDRAGQ